MQAVVMGVCCSKRNVLTVDESVGGKHDRESLISEKVGGTNGKIF